MSTSSVDQANYAYMQQIASPDSGFQVAFTDSPLPNDRSYDESLPDTNYAPPRWGLIETFESATTVAFDADSDQFTVSCQPTTDDRFVVTLQQYLGRSAVRLDTNLSQTQESTVLIAQPYTVCLNVDSEFWKNADDACDDSNSEVFDSDSLEASGPAVPVGDT